MSSNVKFVQNQNNFLHGVRGVIFIDGEIAGAVQDISATEGGEEDIVYAMGSRYPQAKEIKNKLVTGTIKSLVFDPTTQKLLKLTDPATTDVINTENAFLEGSSSGNVYSYDDTQLGFDRSDIEKTSEALMPMFDIDVQSRVVNVGDDGATTTFKGFKIHGVVIKSYEIMFNKDTFWLANVEFIADKMTRYGVNNPLQ